MIPENPETSKTHPYMDVEATLREMHDQMEQALKRSAVPKTCVMAWEIQLKAVLAEMDDQRKMKSRQATRRNTDLNFQGPPYGWGYD